MRNGKVVLAYASFHSQKSWTDLAESFVVTELHFDPYRCTITPHLQSMFLRHSSSFKQLVDIHLQIMEL